MEFNNWDYVVRVVARVGFIALLVGAYQLWHLPVLKKHTNQFFWLATIICISSLMFTTVEFYLVGETQYVLSLIFNTLSTWILAVHLNWRAYKIRRKMSSEKLHQYTDRINTLIEEIKRPTVE